MRPDPEQLHDMYVNQRMSSHRIAELCSVSHTTVKRWLRAAQVPMRPIGNGLASRGLPEPTAEDLQRMVHVEHLSYRAIAARLGVDFTAIPYMLDRHGVRRPTVWHTRRRGVVAREPGRAELAHRISLGESLGSIARDFDVSRGTLGDRCRAYGIDVRPDGWKRLRYQCLDGHAARSVYEQRVDDWLFERRLAHEVEPAYPWDRRYRADFLVGDTYVEVWGVTDNTAYQDRKRMKIKRCAEAGVPLIQINHWQFAKGRRWWRPLARLLNNVEMDELPGMGRSE